MPDPIADSAPADEPTETWRLDECSHTGRYAILADGVFGPIAYLHEHDVGKPGWHRNMERWRLMVSAPGMQAEIDALRAKVQDLSLTVAHEATLRQVAERERDQARAELAAIATVCGLAGVGSHGMSDLDRVKALSLEFGHQIERGDRAEAERDALIALHVERSAVVNRELYDTLLPDQYSPLGWSWTQDFESRADAVAAVRAAAGLGPPGLAPLPVDSRPRCACGKLAARTIAGNARYPMYVCQYCYDQLERTTYTDALDRAAAGLDKLGETS